MAACTRVSLSRYSRPYCLKAYTGVSRFSRDALAPAGKLLLTGRVPFHVARGGHRSGQMNRLLIVRSSGNNTGEGAEQNAEDDDAIQLTEDWREFRAKMVAQSEVERTFEEATDMEEELQQRLEIDKKARVQAASAENLDLLKKQLPKLAEAQPWAHALPVPEKGCLIIANETLFSGSQQYFNQSVIFMVQHDNESGSMGIILNRPTPYSMGRVTDKVGPFGENPVYFGGDVGDGAVSLIHGNPDVKDSLEIRPGIFLGGMESAMQLVNEGNSDPKEYKFFARYAGWGPGQLEAEVKRGTWYCAACAKELVLKPVIQLPKPLWREILELMGGEYAECSRRAYSDSYLDLDQKDQQ